MRSRLNSVQSQSARYAASLLLLTLTACNADGGNIKGTVQKESVEASSAASKDYSGDGTIGKTDGSLPSAPVPAPKEDESVKVPTQITGAYLYCALDKKNADNATTLCGLRDQITNRPFNALDRYKDISWTVHAPDGVTSDVRDLTADKGYWHAKFFLKGQPNFFPQASLQLVYKFNATQISNGQAVFAEEKLKNFNRSYIRLQSQKPHGTEKLRCLDFDFDTDADHKGTTGTCRNNLGQRFNFNQDNTIGVTLGSGGGELCLTYDPGNATSQYVVPKPCGATNLPRPIIRWETNGQQMKIRGENLCLSRTPDQPDPANDYIGLQNCNNSDNQTWEYIPFP